MARHPEYKIIEVRIKDGERSEKVVSKELMYKCDAQRVVDWKNRTDATFIDSDNKHYWQVIRKDGRAW